MAKSNHIPGLLLVVVVWVFVGLASSLVEYKVDGIRYKELGGEERQYQVSRIRHQDGGGETPHISLITEDADTADESRVRVKKLYDSQIGVREQGNNSGPQVEKYLRYVGLGRGEPWCAAFVCWVFGEAGVSNPKSGWSPALFPSKKVIWTRSAKLTLPSYPPSLTAGNPQLATLTVATPERADIFGIYFTDKKRIAHVGFIDNWNEDWVTTVEGNTNDSGSREGDGVYRKRRLTQSVYQVARYINHISFINKNRNHGNI